MIRNNIEKIIVISLLDLKLKYQGSFFGLLWSFMKPLLMFIVYFSIFGLILKLNTGFEYALSLFLGVLVWNYFAEATSLGLNSFIGKAGIITKLYVNKLIFPISALLTSFYSFLVNLTIFFIIYFTTHIILNKTIPRINVMDLSFFFLGILLISLLILGLNIMLACLNTFFRDFQQIWELVLTYGVFLTPIIFPLPIPEKYKTLYYYINPLAFALEAIKSPFFDKYKIREIYSISIWIKEFFICVFLIIFSLIVYNFLKKKIVNYL